MLRQDEYEAIQIEDTQVESTQAVDSCAKGVMPIVAAACTVSGCMLLGVAIGLSLNSTLGIKMGAWLGGLGGALIPVSVTFAGDKLKNISCERLSNCCSSFFSSSKLQRIDDEPLVQEIVTHKL